ncbi:11574_t:CDS:2 [Diversispora eburnea]|uniref:11574_t:CDS:1 n=1 Tax=Diversispora eburnea TaxID=1213867 RepID=A0A9N9CCT4_9GLOM|nr:11574_t:CDS:2 [Diversispora eburnea]
MADNVIKSQKYKSSLSSSISHPQSCYISRSIHTLHGLHNSLENIKSGKSQDPNLLKSNESTASSVSTYDIDSKESQECFNWEKEIQNHTKKKTIH